MPQDFDEFVEKLQKKIMKLELEEHNEKIVKLCYNPQNWGKPPNEEITVSEELRGGPKSYFLGLYLKVENDIITKANFITDGCGVMIATGSQTTILVEGNSISYAENLTSEDIDSELMGLPESEKHCADLSIETLKRAIKNYKSRQLI